MSNDRGNITFLLVLPLVLVVEIKTSLALFRFIPESRIDYARQTYRTAIILYHKMVDYICER